MHSNKDEEIWNDFLTERKKTPSVDSAFTQRVMASVRALEYAAKSAQKTNKTGSENSLVNFLDRVTNSFGYKPMLAFASLMFFVGIITLLQIQNRKDISVIAETTRIKGENFKLGFLLKRGATIGKAVTGDFFQPGDKLQAIYSASSQGYLHLLSLDQSGKIECFSCQDKASPLLAGQEKTLDFALELDTSALSEIMIGYWSPQFIPYSVIESKIHQALQASGFRPSEIGSRLSKQLRNGEKVSLFILNKKGKV